MLEWIKGAGEGMENPSHQVADPLPNKRVHLCTNLRYPFLVTEPKSFLMASPAPIYTNFERGARAKKKNTFGHFWTCFYQKFSKSA